MREEIISELEELISIYRDAKLYGEVFGLKIALDLIKRNEGEDDTI